MFTAYLVDDEELILEDMKSSIAWEEQNIKVLGSSTNPQKAIAEIRIMCPEVVFTDIRMPGIDGIGLLEILIQENANIEFVIISAHENFEYAQKLLRLGAFDYLIKPVQKSQYEELFARLTARLEEKYPHKDLPNTSSSELNDIILYLNKNISKKHSLSKIATRSNFSTNYICSLFSKHLYTTFSSYLTKIRMEEAARSLSSTTKPVKEIALSCGYDDYFYFCRVFRNFYNCTPTEYRSEK